MLEKQTGPFKQLIQLIFQDVTPVRLRLLFVSGCLGAFLFCLLSIITINQHEHAVVTVGRDAAPSVIAAHQIKTGVERMDADLANELLYPRGSEEGKQMFADFEKWRAVVGKQMIAAAKNITYGEAEQIPIENIQYSLGVFEMYAQSARDARLLGRDAEVLRIYKRARATLEDTVLPNAEALNKANSDKLESIYSQEISRSSLSCGFILAVGLLLIGLLLFTQGYLAKRFHRRLSVPLLVATLCTVIFVQHLYKELRTNAYDLKVAKEDAYNSIVALLEARSNAYAADAAQSRSLLDREKSTSHEKYFSDKVATVASFLPGHNFAETIARARSQLNVEAQYKLPGFTGSLADELKNIRFEGEARSALEALEAFSNYCLANAAMQQLEQAGAHGDAVHIGLGYSPNQSKYWFANFDDALQQTLDINQEHFGRAVKSAFRDIAGLKLLSQLLFLLVVVCIYFGLRDRMAEYV